MPESALKVIEWWVVQLITLSLPTKVVVELGCENLYFQGFASAYSASPQKDIAKPLVLTQLAIFRRKKWWPFWMFLFHKHTQFIVLEFGIANVLCIIKLTLFLTGPSLLPSATMYFGELPQLGHEKTLRSSNLILEKKPQMALLRSWYVKDDFGIPRECKTCFLDLIKSWFVTKVLNWINMA